MGGPSLTRPGGRSPLGGRTGAQGKCGGDNEGEWSGSLLEDSAGANVLGKWQVQGKHLIHSDFQN